MTINIFVIGLFQPLLPPNQLAVVEIIDAHRVADVVKRGLGLGDGNFAFRYEITDVLGNKIQTDLVYQTYKNGRVVK